MLGEGGQEPFSEGPSTKFPSVPGERCVKSRFSPGRQLTPFHPLSIQLIEQGEDFFQEMERWKQTCSRQSGMASSSLPVDRGSLGTNSSRRAGWHRTLCATCVRVAGDGGRF